MMGTEAKTENVFAFFNSIVLAFMGIESVLISNRKLRKFLYISVE